MKRLVFVCVGNAGRSQMAEAFAKHLGQGRIEVFSAGTIPAKEVNLTVVKVMLEKDIDISKNKPKKLTSEMLKGVDAVITMGCSVQDVCPVPLLKNVEDWHLEDPKGKPIEKIREIRDEIERRVVELLDRLLNQK